MSEVQTSIIGCGNIGQRIAAALLKQGNDPKTINGLVNSSASMHKCQALNIQSSLIDLDKSTTTLPSLHKQDCYYTVAPPAIAMQDLRSRALIAHLERAVQRPSKIVLLSTTGVYGDCKGEWVDETKPPMPTTERGLRRLDSETVWQNFATAQGIPLMILRVPGIYSLDRLPRARIAKRTPVVSASECGFSNRVHAEDLAQIAVTSMAYLERDTSDSVVLNASDGAPSKITEYLQAAAKQLGEPNLPVISMAEAQEQLSDGMLSYLSESRKISNAKLLAILDYKYLYPDFREGIKH